MSVRWLFGLALLLGCKRAVAPPPVASEAAPAGVDEVPILRVGPGRWVGGGFELTVPAGWAGTEGPAPRLVGVRQEDSGVELALWAYELPLGGPRRAEGEVCDFVDRGAHRAVPALGVAHTARCEGGGRVRQTWWALVDGREVHVELSAPEWRAVRGWQTAAPLVRDLVRRPAP